MLWMRTQLVLRSTLAAVLVGVLLIPSAAWACTAQRCMLKADPVGGPQPSCCSGCSDSQSSHRPEPVEKCDCPPGCPAPCGYGQPPYMPCARATGQVLDVPLELHIEAPLICASSTVLDGIFRPPRA
jgi:hypothetical protein